MPTTGRSLALLDAHRWRPGLFGVPAALDQDQAVARICHERLFGSWQPWPPNQLAVTVTGPEGFEAGLPGGWSASGGTPTQSTAAAYSGTASALLTVTGTPTQALLRSPAVAVRTGQQARLAMACMAPAGYSSWQVAIDWYAAGAYVSTSVTSPATLAAGVWTVADQTWTVPADVDTAIYGPTLAGSPGAGLLLYTDHIGLTLTETRAAVQIDWSWLSGPLSMRPDPPVNDQSVTRGTAGTARALNAASRATYGAFAGASISLDGVLEADPQGLANWITTFEAAPRLRLPRIVIPLLPLTDDQRALVLGIEQGQRITLVNTPAGWPYHLRDLVVEGVEDTIAVDGRVIAFNTSPLAGSAPGQQGPWFTLDSSVLGGSDQLTY